MDNVSKVPFKRPIGDVSEDEFLSQMKENGQRFRKLLGIRKLDIDKALEEINCSSIKELTEYEKTFLETAEDEMQSMLDTMDGK